jgi:ribA/ribD-fused uncharacterized protein
MAISFTKVNLPYGWCGNMAPYAVEYAGKRWRTTEALFQALRFDDEAIREEIRATSSPMSAKWTAKKYIKLGKHVVVPQSEPDLANMVLALRLKLAQHPELRQQLLDTGDEVIIEDCGKRQGGSGMFWGAAFKEGRWVGENTLGKLWMRIREALRQESRVSGRQ